MTFQERVRANMLAEQAAASQQRNPLRDRVRANMAVSPMPEERIKTEIPSVEQPLEEERGFLDKAKDFGSGVYKGIGQSAAKTALGVADLFGGVDEYDRKAMEMWGKDVSDAGAGGMVGQGIGEIAQLALPASWAGKGAKALGLSKTLGKAAPVLGEMALGAGAGAVQLPEAGDSRLTNTLQGAALGAAGAGVAKGLSKAVSGATKSKAAKELLAEGVPLSAGQQTTGIGQGIEELLAVFPLTARKIKDMRTAGTEGYSNYVINQARPSVSKVKIAGTGPEAIQALKGQVKGGYDDAWKSAKGLTEDSYDTLQGQLNSGLKTLTTDERAVMSRVQREINDAFPITTKGQAKTAKQEAIKQIRTPKDNAAKQVDKVISKQLKASKDNPELVKQLKTVRLQLRADIGKEASSALNKMDSDYTKYLTVRDAADAAASGDTAGDFSAQMISNASGRYGPKGSKGMGTSPLYNEMRQGAETVDKTKIGGVLDRFRRVMQLAPTLPPLGVTTEMGMNTLAGESMVQRALKGQNLVKKLGYDEDAAKALAEMLRKGGYQRGIQGFNE